MRKVLVSVLTAGLLGVPALPGWAAPADPDAHLIPAGFPTAETTGVPKGLRLIQHVGNIDVRKDGTVLDRLDIAGCVTVRAHDVVIKRSRIRCDDKPGIWPVRKYPGYRQLLVEAVEIDGAGSATVATFGEDMTLRRLNIHNVIDGPRLGSRTVVEDSYIHGLVHKPGTHNDTLQTIGGTDIVVRRNTLLAYSSRTDDPHNAALQTGRLHTPLARMVVQGNFLDGGSYSVRGGSGERDGHLITDYVFRDNVFGPNCGFGPASGIEAPVEWESTNRWYRSGRSVTADAQVERHGCDKRHRSALGDNILTAGSDDISAVSASLKLAATSSPSVYGQPVKITAQLQGVPVGEPGTVHFTISGREFRLSTVEVTRTGSAVVSLPPLAGGTHEVAAVFKPAIRSRAPELAGSFQHRVLAARTKSVLAQSEDAARHTALTGSVTVLAPSTGFARGTVHWLYEGGPAGVAHISSGRFSVPTTGVSQGRQTLLLQFEPVSGDHAPSSTSLRFTLK